MAAELVLTVGYHAGIFEVSDTAYENWSKRLIVPGIIAALPIFVAAVSTPIALNNAEGGVVPAVQSWASEEYTIDLTDDQVNMMIDRINLENPSDDVTGTLVINNNGTEEPILWHFVNGNKIMLTDMDMNPLPAQDK